MRTILKFICVFLLFILSACFEKTTPSPTSTPFPTPTPKLICPLCFSAISTPQQQPTTSLTLVSKDQDFFLLIEDRKTSKLVNTDGGVVENCYGISDISNTFLFEKAFTSSVETGTDVSATGGIKDIVELSASISTYYKLNLGESEAHKINVNFIAPPGYRVIYTVEWYDVWIEGRIIPVDKLQLGEKEEFFYRAKTGIESRVPNPIPEYCAPTPTSSLTPTLLPTATVTPTLVIPTLTHPPALEPTMPPSPTSTP